MNILKLKSTGSDVKKIQEFLGLQADGIFGSKTEEAVKKWQKEHNLVADGIVGDKTWKAMFPSIQQSKQDWITYNPINVHISKSPGREIKYLVIHFTAGAHSRKGAAEGCRRVFLSRQASADFAVDDETILQINPDPKTYYTWAVGDGKGKYGVTNRNSISIEICSNIKKGFLPKYSNHDGWYFTEASLDNAVKLAKELMIKYNIPIDRVIRHYDATRKLCPGIIGWNPEMLHDPNTGKSTGIRNNEDEWKKFKKRLI